MLVLVLLLAGTAANAAEFTTSGGSQVYQGTFESFAPVQLTQNFDITTIESVQVACGVAGTYTTQNWYLRRFLLAVDHGVTDPLTVQSVDFGVEQIDMADGSVPPPFDVDVVLFEAGVGSPALFANMIEIARATKTLGAGDVGTIVNQAIGAGIADPNTTDLWVALDAPDGSVIGVGLQFRPGGNGVGVLRDAYIAATNCAISDPTGVSAIGFPDSQTIFVVNGETGGGTPTIESSWGQVKALYR
jgi:hypothetical protein